MEQPEWLEDHLPAQMYLKWPIYRKYKITSLYDYIKTMSKPSDKPSDESLNELSEEQWEVLEQQIGDVGAETLSRIFLVYIEDDEVKKYCDPFSDFSKTIIEEFYELGESLKHNKPLGKGRNTSKIELLDKWLKKYGAPFSLESPPPDIGHAPRFYLDEITLGALAIEKVLYDAFNKRVILTNHIFWRAREIGAIEEIYIYCLNRGKNSEYIAEFRDLLEEGTPLTDENIYSTANRILHYRMAEYLSQCKITLESVSLSDNWMLKAVKPYIEPPDLLTALWLKLNHLLFIKGPISACKECGYPFLVTRDWHEYCCDTCAARARKRHSRKEAKKRLEASETINNSD